MPPRHFWILAETLRAEDTKPKFSDEERRKIQDMLDGNDDGWW
jgi:hypothetical protein